jgi:hypothetical protein
MTFQPVVPFTGLVGWTFLNRTLENQQDAFRKSPEIARDADYFRDRIGSLTSAEALVSDRRLLRVALGAFGLDEDIDNRFFIRKVLEDGTLDPEALSNKLADKRYREFSRAFGFGDFAIPLSQAPGFADRTVAAFETRQFEIAVGDADQNMRLALGLTRDLGEIAARPSADTTLWLTVLGSPSLRAVFETAFGLPTGFGAIDLDRQVEVLRARARQAFGADTVSQFADPEQLEALTRRFLLRADLQAGPSGVSGGAIALQLLQAAPGLRVF